MAHARYVGRKDPKTGEIPDDEHQVTRAFGHKFVVDQWVDISGLPEAHQLKLKGNPVFEYSEEAPEASKELDPARVPGSGKGGQAKA